MRVVLLVVIAMAVPVAPLPTTVALAGRYTVLSCPGDAGWSQDAPSAQFVTYQDGCGGSAAGGLSLALGPNPDSGYVTNSGGAITFSVPAGFSISSYAMRLIADGGPCSIASNQCATGFGEVWVNHTGQADPDYDYRNLGYGSQSVEIGPSALSGVNWVTVGVGCDGGPGGYECAGSDGSAPEALADVLSADFVIDSEASPSASGFSGTLLEPDAHGTADLQFTATDPGGPGVYLVSVQIDGATVYNGTPNGNEGTCAAVGTYSNGSWEFEALQPCKQSETVDVPVNTTTLSDGEHTLRVTVTDAAENSSVVYDATITTANRTTVSSLLSSPLVVAPGVEPTYAIVLGKQTTALGKSVRRSYENSALTLSGRACARRMARPRQASRSRWWLNRVTPRPARSSCSLTPRATRLGNGYCMRPRDPRGCCGSSTGARRRPRPPPRARVSRSVRRSHRWCPCACAHLGVRGWCSPGESRSVPWERRGRWSRSKPRRVGNGRWSATRYVSTRAALIATSFRARR